MWKNNKPLKLCGRITVIVILLSILRPYPMFAEQPTEQKPNLSENEMKRYSDLEVDCLAELDLLIDDLTEAALEAIEQAAGEAAKAAALAMLEREAAALREAQKWRLEAEANFQAIGVTRKAGRKNTVIAALIGVLGGLTVGISGTLIIGGR